MLAALACLGLSTFSALRLPSFFGADERPHFSYTVMLLEGRLPELTDAQPFTDTYPIIERSLTPPDGTPPRQQAIFVANHPPLAYVLAAPAVWLAGAGGSDDWPPLAFRLVNATAMAAGVALAGLLAGELFPRRPGIATSAAVLTAVVPALVSVAGYAHNDGTAFLMTTACLLVTVRLLRRGMTPASLAVASLVAGGALLSRVSSAVAVTAVVAAAAVASWRDSDGVWRADGGVSAAGVARALARAAGSAIVIGATVAAAAGWFFLRNRRLYGTATADTFLLSAFRRTPRGGLRDVLTEGDWQLAMWSKVYGSVHPRLVAGEPERLVAGLVAIGAVGLVVAVARRVRRRSSTDGPTAARPEPGQDTTDGPADPGRSGIGVVGWLILAGFCVGVVLGTASFYADGGSPHPRYLLSIVPLVSALVARALAELPWPRLGTAVIAAVFLAITVSQFARYPDLIDDPTRRRPFLHSAGPAVAQAGALTLAAGALATLVALWIADWWRSRSRPGEAVPDGAEAARRARDVGAARV